MARHGKGPTLEAAGHRTHLSTDVGGFDLFASEWFQDLHCHRLWSGFCAALFATGLRHPTRAAGRLGAIAHRLFCQWREGILKYDLDGMGAAAAFRRAAE